MDKIALHGAEKHYFEKRTVRITALVLAAVLSVLFSLALGIDFEPERAIFKSGSVLGAVVFYAAIGFSAVIFVLTFVLVKGENPENGAFPVENECRDYYKLDNSFIKVIRIAFAVVLVIEGVVRAVYDGMRGSSYLLMVAALLLSVAFALYFVPELTEKLGGIRVHLGCGIFGMAYMLLMTFVIYFDRTYPLASEYMVLNQIGYILALLAITYELRYRFAGTHIRARLASLCAAFVFGFGFGVGKLIMLMAKGQVNYGDTASAVVMLVISVYFGARIFFYSED